MLARLNLPTLKRVLSILLSILIIAASLPIFTVAYNQVLTRVGLRKIPVPVVGTGSMYPSLFWDVSEGGPDDASESALLEERTTPLMYSYIPNIELRGYNLGLREIGRGDIVAFKNAQTAGILEAEGEDSNSGFVKRVIAVDGDTIELRDGYVILNGEVLDEPYIHKPRSTYGGSTLLDCQALQVPTGKLFVLGDNRKLSDDSRFELGLINKSDVNFVLPRDEQNIYEALWRDTSGDDELANTPSMNRQALYDLLNNSRQEAGVKPLNRSSALELSTSLRGNKILETNDFSIEATISGYTTKDAMTDAGYANIITGEILSHGYYTADELFDNIMYFNSTASQILNSQYQEVGFSVVNGEVNGCPTQVIVGHLGGYIPAEYDEEVVASWGSLIDNLNSVVPSWENAKNNPSINQEKLDEVIALLHKRLTLATEIYNTMIENRWLSEDQKSRIEQDEHDAEKLNTLINEINNQ